MMLKTYAFVYLEGVLAEECDYSLRDLRHANVANIMCSL